MLLCCLHQLRERSVHEQAWNTDAGLQELQWGRLRRRAWIQRCLQQRTSGLPVGQHALISPLLKVLPLAAIQRSVPSL
ncbi:hypothetical protein AMECASPLE_028155, partial [Ameca splendens]